MNTAPRHFLEARRSQRLEGESSIGIIFVAHGGSRCRGAPQAKSLLGVKGYDADWFREALGECKIEACAPSESNRKIHIRKDAILCCNLHNIEIMFGR
jgi:hypothetical protein